MGDFIPSHNIVKIKKKVLGGKKTDVEATAIINPKTGNLALSKGEIKKVSLQYTKEPLMSNPIEEGVAEEIEQKKVATRKFLKESGGTYEINKEIFEKVLAKFKGSIKRNYGVIVRADKMFQEKVYELCQIKAVQTKSKMNKEKKDGLAWQKKQKKSAKD